MPEHRHYLNVLRHLKRTFPIVMIAWTVFVFLGGALQIFTQYEHIADSALIQAIQSFEKDVVYRNWVAEYVGVYVPVTKETLPSPYLAHITDRDVTTISGMKLTLLNPGYVIKQVHKVGRNEFGHQAHLTSLNPINSKNIPDAWESEALRSFADGVVAVSEVAEIDGVEYMRLMRPMFIEESCMKFHAAHGYDVGDLRGGISVSVPMAPLKKMFYHDTALLIMGYVIVWLLGLGGIWVAVSRIARRVQERHLIEDALSRSEERFRALYESSRDAIMTLAPPDWRFRSGNPATVSMFRAKDEHDFISHEPWALSPERQPDGRESGEKAKEMIETAMRDGSNFFEWTHTRTDGEDFSATVLLARMEVAGKTFLQATVRDITEQKEMAVELVESEERYRVLFDGAVEGILVADIETQKLLFANQAICELLGYSEDELTCMDVQGIHPKESLAMVMETFEAQARGDLSVTEMPCLCSDGRIIFADVKTNTVKLKGRHCIVGFFSDVTLRKQAEKLKQVLGNQVRQQQKLAAVGTLASGAAHEINNPINGIMNYAQLILDKIDANSQASGFANEIIVEAERIASIIRSLLALSSDNQDVCVPVHINDLLELTLKPVRASLSCDDIVVDIVLADDLPVISCQPRQVQILLTNLLENARDALNERYPNADDNKIIKITGKQFTDGDKSLLRITIEDYGNGVPLEIRERIYEPFFTTRERAVGAGAVGRGLGLTTALNIASDHGGNLDMKCEPGEYTRLILDLPIDNNLNSEGQPTENDNV